MTVGNEYNRRQIEIMGESLEIIDKIVSIEWNMFTSVNEEKDRANCQKDKKTFIGMRTAQFSAWSLKTLTSYLDDLEKARKNGRNLLEEKYIHMMKATEPSLYGALLSRVIQPTDVSRALAVEITGKLLEQTRVLFEKYPHVSGRGRPLYSTLDKEDISIETYQFCELLTYSEATLAALGEHIAALENVGVSLAREIFENTVTFFGYGSLETADAAMVGGGIDKCGK